MKVTNSVLLGAVLFALLQPSNPVFADVVGPGEVYTAVRSLVEARQQGLYIKGQERSFSEGITAYCSKDLDKAHSILDETTRALQFEIENKQRHLTKKFVSANDVLPVVEQDGAVKIWTLMSAKNGDVVWTKAVKEIVIEPKAVWSPAVENVERGIVIVNGRGSATVDGHSADVFREDVFAVPPNVSLSISSADNYPITILVSEAFTDARGSEISELEEGVKWADPWLNISADSGVSKDGATSVFDAATAAIQEASNNGVVLNSEVYISYDIAQECLAGSNFDAAQSFARIAIDWTERTIDEFVQDRANLAENGLVVANKMQSDVPVFHNDTTHAYMSAWALPFKYHEFVLPFEILADTRLGPHQHNKEELYYILNGRGKMLVADPKGARYFDREQGGLESSPGTLISIPDNSLHSIYPVGNASLVHAIAIGSWSNEKQIVHDIEMHVDPNPWTPESWINAYAPKE